MAPLFLILSVWSGEAEGPLAALVTVYKTAPQEYPSGTDERGVAYARPNLAAWYRWHYYNESMDRCTDAAVERVVQSYNPLEGAAVRVPAGSQARCEFVAEHATQGVQALKAEFPGGKAHAIAIQECMGPTMNPGNNPSRHHVAAYWCHFRWLKLDVFNPTADEIWVRVNEAPFVLRPGAQVLAVRTPDAINPMGAHAAIQNELRIWVERPEQGATLFLDHVRMEQEVPAVFCKQGRLFHFAARSTDQGKTGAPILWPGFTAVEKDTLYQKQTGFGWTLPPTTRRYEGSTFRSAENGFLWGHAAQLDSPFRVDLPNGRYGIYFLPFAGCGHNELNHARDELKLKVNGKEEIIQAALSGEELRRLAWAGEAWDWRPGSSVWRELVWPLSGRSDRVVFAEVTDGHLLLEMPYARALLIFPEREKAQALRGIGRFKYLLAESWDVTHAWIRGPAAQQAMYNGFHEESGRPENIPGKLEALGLRQADFERGFLVFRRDLLEPVYPDSIPAEEEARSPLLSCVAAPGTRVCMTLGVLPLAELNGFTVEASSLAGPGGVELSARHLEVRVGRYHHHTMGFGHHNHTCNIMEHYLVKRPVLRLHPGAARRLYFDLSVPVEAKPGRYGGRITLGSAGRTVEVPWTVEVFPIRLQDAPVAFLGEKSHPGLLAFGLSGLDAWKAPLPPVYLISGQKCHSHEFGKALKPQPAHPALLAKLANAGEPFWLADQIRHGKEHAARFTYGFWLWHSGASGRVTPVGLGQTGQVGRGAYHTLCSGNTNNVYRAVIESLTPGEWNPSRDLMLLREGILDYRFVYTLDRLVQEAVGPAKDAAKAFLEDLRRSLPLDLSSYYQMRCGSYSEDWYPKPDQQWKASKFEAVRRECARHLQALQSAAGYKGGEQGVRDP